VRAPQRTIATMDHSTPTTPGGFKAMPVLDQSATSRKAQLDQLAKNCEEFGIPLLALGDKRQGIVHVIGPELGLTQPGMTVVCGDSHTSTHGAFGALAFGIGTSQVAHVLASQCLLQTRPKTLEVRVDGTLRPGVSLRMSSLLSVHGSASVARPGHVIEYTGSVIRALSMEERMTVCNMSIEAGARAGMIAPDETTFEYLKGRPHAPQGAEWDAAVADWSTLRTDEGATYDRTIVIDGSALEPWITYGTNPGMGMSINQPVPDPASLSDRSERDSAVKALKYMGLTAGEEARRHAGGRRLLRQLHQRAHQRPARRGHGAARAARRAERARARRAGLAAGEAAGRGRGTRRDLQGSRGRVARGRLLDVHRDERRPAPSRTARRLDEQPQLRGRQGSGGRTLLASPLTAAAAAVTGVITDPRTLLEVAV
jgi:3-isopropylmalate/(R)-2-methylmalate dehydratase large subunit